MQPFQLVIIQFLLVPTYCVSTNIYSVHFCSAYFSPCTYFQGRGGISFHILIEWSVYWTHIYFCRKMLCNTIKKYIKRSAYCKKKKKVYIISTSPILLSFFSLFVYFTLVIYFFLSVFCQTHVCIFFDHTKNVKLFTNLGHCLSWNHCWMY